MISEQQFVKVTNDVIDRLEGGYYHPDMLLDGRVKDPRYAGSGETMMGIDRVAGGKINTSLSGKQFWSIIDNAGARSKWAWGYRGGSLEPQLRQLASKIMYPHYLDLSKRYLSEKAREIVDKDPRLTFHFSYASWNGAGWFQKFADVINKEVKNGNTNPNSLIRIAINNRKSSSSSLIAQGGRKMEEFLYDLYELPMKVGAALKKKWPLALGLSLLFGAGIWAAVSYSQSQT